jgi:hypothetical protein
MMHGNQSRADATRARKCRRGNRIGICAACDLGCSSRWQGCLCVSNARLAILLGQNNLVCSKWPSHVYVIYMALISIDKDNLCSDDDLCMQRFTTFRVCPNSCEIWQLLLLIDKSRPSELWNGRKPLTAHTDLALRRTIASHKTVNAPFNHFHS